MTSLNKEQQRFKSQCQEKVERQRKLENQAANEAGFSYFQKAIACTIGGQHIRLKHIFCIETH